MTATFSLLVHAALPVEQWTPRSRFEFGLVVATAISMVAHAYTILVAPTHWSSLLWWCWLGLYISVIGYFLQHDAIRGVGAWMSITGFAIWIVYLFNNGEMTITSFPAHILAGSLGVYVLLRVKWERQTIPWAFFLSFVALVFSRVLGDPVTNVNGTSSLPPEYVFDVSYGVYWVLNFLLFFVTLVTLTWANHVITSRDGWIAPIPVERETYTSSNQNYARWST